MNKSRQRIAIEKAQETVGNLREKAVGGDESSLELQSIQANVRALQVDLGFLWSSLGRSLVGVDYEGFRRRLGSDLGHETRTTTLDLDPASESAERALTDAGRADKDF